MHLSYILREITRLVRPQTVFPVFFYAQVGCLPALCPLTQDYKMYGSSAREFDDMHRLACQIRQTKIACIFGSRLGSLFKVSTI